LQCAPKNAQALLIEAKNLTMSGDIWGFLGNRKMPSITGKRKAKGCGPGVRVPFVAQTAQTSLRERLQKGGEEKMGHLGQTTIKPYRCGQKQRARGEVNTLNGPNNESLWLGLKNRAKKKKKRKKKEATVGERTMEKRPPWGSKARKRP